MRLDDGWNQIQFNLSDFTRRAYGTNYIETLRVQVSQKGSWTRVGSWSKMQYTDLLPSLVLDLCASLPTLMVIAMASLVTIGVGETAHTDLGPG